jgi:hypothetical protein
MREIEPSIALRATEAASQEQKLGIQIGEPIGHSRPPRVYLSRHEFPNAGIAGVVTEIMESGGITEAWEISESRSLEEQLVDQAAECVQDFLEGFNPDDGGTLFLAGNEEWADDVVDRVTVHDTLSVKVNEGEPQYIPEPDS